MIEFIPEAAAAPMAPGPEQPSLLGILMPFIILALFMWFFLFRPQRKQRQEHRRMIEGLQKGDEIITAGGLVGKIIDFRAHWIIVEVADKVELRIQRTAIVTTLPNGTIEADEPAKANEPSSSEGATGG